MNAKELAEAELAALRTGPESGDVAMMVTKLRLQRPAESVGKQHYSLDEVVVNMAQAADLLTRLSAALAEAERDRDEWKFCVERFEEQRDAAEAALETARRDALEEAATVALEQRCERSTGWDAACTSIAETIRALSPAQQKGTT